ncbi:hypothetical protein [Streptomyces acidicola]|nr:hypothetical protein [Streptomyces acidicola]
MTAPAEVPVLWLQALCLTALRILRLEAALTAARHTNTRLKGEAA